MLADGFWTSNGGLFTISPSVPTVTELQKCSLRETPDRDGTFGRGGLVGLGLSLVSVPGRVSSSACSRH